jgi:hypothetical protein
MGESPPAPDFLIINTERAGSFFSCSMAFNCTVYSDPADGSAFEGYVTGGADPIVTFQETFEVSGLGCPSQAPVEGEYEITVPEDGLESNN